MEKYILTSTIYHTKKKFIFYGIALVKISMGMCELVKKYNDISENKGIVESLVDNCNKLKLDESQLIEVLENLLNA